MLCFSHSVRSHPRPIMRYTYIYICHSQSWYQRLYHLVICRSAGVVGVWHQSCRLILQNLYQSWSQVRRGFIRPWRDSHLCLTGCSLSTHTFVVEVSLPNLATPVRKKLWSNPNPRKYCLRRFSSRIIVNGDARVTSDVRICTHL